MTPQLDCSGFVESHVLNSRQRYHGIRDPLEGVGRRVAGDRGKGEVCVFLVAPATSTAHVDSTKAGTVRQGCSARSDKHFGIRWCEDGHAEGEVGNRGDGRSDLGCLSSANGVLGDWVSNERVSNLFVFSVEIASASTSASYSWHLVADGGARKEGAGMEFTCSHPSAMRCGFPGVESLILIRDSGACRLDSCASSSEPE